MASKLSILSAISILVLVLFFPASSLAKSPTPSFTTPDAVCRETAHPSFCTSSLRNHKPAATIHDYARTSISNSLSRARKLLSHVEHYLRSLSSSKSSEESNIRVLQGCQFLAQRNVDLLSRTLHVASNSTHVLERLKVSDLHTWLSATLTNENSCLDLLKSMTKSASAIKNGLARALSETKMHHAVSLGLFHHGWVRDSEKAGVMEQRANSFHGEAMHSVKVSKTVYVSRDGKGNFRTISEAVAAAPANTDSGSGYFVIRIAAGHYHEYISVPANKRYVMMIGAGYGQTVIVGYRGMGNGWNIQNSAPLGVDGDGFVGVNLTIRNKAGPYNGQSVAVRNGADLSTFYRCSIEGYQDTLYAQSQRQFYRECDIYGTVDYIFGNAAAVFQNCNIYSRLPIRGQSDVVTAQAREYIQQNTGYSLQNCNIKAARGLIRAHDGTKIFLGRPWRMYAITVVMQSFIDKLVDPAGWNPWYGNFLATLFYAEFSNTGPGAITSNRVKWPGFHVLQWNDAARYTVSNFIQGDHWLPATGVPYQGGL